MRFLRLILDTSKAPSKIGSLRGINFVIFTLVTAGLLNFLCVSLADAGLFSFLDKIWGTENKPEVVQGDSNSQNISLLASVSSPFGDSGLGGGGITIVNQSALLPDVGPLGSVADISTEDGIENFSGRVSLYVVREGDNLSKIAKLFGVSVNTIVWANDIAGVNTIRTGQVLVILPVTGVRYAVKTGDTLASIAKKFKGSEEEISQFNGLTGEHPVVGQEIIIPDGEASYIPSAVQPQRFVSGSGGPNYGGYYLRPIEGGIKSQGLHGYNGVDLATYCGAPIVAAATGDVMVARSYGPGGYGKYIIISHLNGTQTLYAHASEIIVTPGWHVVKGQVIGYVGTTGKSTGCHVHFEVRGAKNPF